MARQPNADLIEAHSVSTLSLGQTLQGPVVLESQVFAGKLRLEVLSAEEQIALLDSQITAIQRRRDDLQKTASAGRQILIMLEGNAE